VDAVYIAAENETLQHAALEFTPNVIMTSSRHINGMERIGEAEAWLPASCKVMPHIHADAPLTNPDHIDAIVSKLSKQSPESKVVAVTLRRKVVSEKEARNGALAKIVTREDGRVLYISRALIPESKFGKFNASGDDNYYINANMWVFAKGYHEKYLRTPSTALQLTEDIEYLKILEAGLEIQTVDVEKTGREVNQYKDYVFVRAAIEAAQGGEYDDKNERIMKKYSIPMPPLSDDYH